MQMRILLAEDNKPLRETLANLLQEYGHDTDVVHNGKEALTKALEWDFDVIVSDIMMPELDGVEMLKRLRQKKQTPVILLTAKSTIMDKVHGLESGADDYLTKPFDIKELIARIDSVARRFQSATTTLIQIGALKIDTLNRIISLNNQTIPCTSKEYALIELLAKNSNKILSRNEIFKLIFDDEDESSSNVLEVYIYKLRKKISKDFIMTKRGKGYQLGIK